MVETKNDNEMLQEFEKLREEINKLRENIDKSYYSVPKNEFETVTVTKITQEVMERMNKRISSWRNWAAIVIIILSFFGITQGDRLIRPIIESKVKESTEKIENTMNDKVRDLNSMIRETLKDLKEAKIDLKEDIKEEFKIISKNIDEKATVAAKEAAKQETERQLETVRDDIKSAQKTVLKTELNTLINEVKSRRLNYKDALRKLNPLLQRVIRLNDKELANKFLDYLFRWTYKNRSYEDLDELRIQYENDFDFKETTWANIAIGDMILYEESFSPIYKERAISAIENSLNKMPNYGTPYAVRLIIHMLDYKKKKDQEVKESEKREALKLIDIVNSGTMPLTSFETYDYFIRSKGTRFYKYVELLFENFPEPMELMSKRSKQYINLLKTAPKDKVLKKWDKMMQ